MSMNNARSRRVSSRASVSDIEGSREAYRGSYDAYSCLCVNLRHTRSRLDVSILFRYLHVECSSRRFKQSFLFFETPGAVCSASEHDSFASRTQIAAKRARGRVSRANVHIDDREIHFGRKRLWTAGFETGFASIYAEIFQGKSILVAGGDFSRLDEATIEGEKREAARFLGTRSTRLESHLAGFHASRSDFESSLLFFAGPAGRRRWHHSVGHYVGRVDDRRRRMGTRRWSTFAMRRVFLQR